MHVLFSKIFCFQYLATARGLVFKKFSATEMKKPEKARKPEEEIYYWGDVGSVTGEKGHEEDEYKRIAGTILAEKNEGEWPEEVVVEVLAGNRNEDKNHQARIFHKWTFPLKSDHTHLNAKPRFREESDLNKTSIFPLAFVSPTPSFLVRLVSFEILAILSAAIHPSIFSSCGDMIRMLLYIV